MQKDRKKSVNNVIAYWWCNFIMPAVKKVRIVYTGWILAITIIKYCYKTHTSGSIPPIMHPPPPLHSTYTHRPHIIVLPLCSMTTAVVGLCATKKPFRISFSLHDQTWPALFLFHPWGGVVSVSVSVSLSVRNDISSSSSSLSCPSQYMTYNGCPSSKTSGLLQRTKNVLPNLMRWLTVWMGILLGVPMRHWGRISAQIHGTTRICAKVTDMGQK